jgi:hypothetical protein
MDAVAISLIVIPLALILFTVRVEKSAVASYLNLLIPNSYPLVTVRVVINAFVRFNMHAGQLTVYGVGGKSFLLP